MDPSTYRTIMIGPILAKLYGTVMEEALSTLAEGEGLCAAEHAGIRRAFSTTNHIFTLRCLIDQARVKKRRLHCCFVDFRKAFDTVPKERLFRRLAALGVGDEMMWAIFALYERVTGRVKCPGGLSDPLVNTIGVKQGCPLSPTLFGLYIDEIVSFIQSRGGEGVELGDTTVHILLYADDIVLVSESAVLGLKALNGLLFCDSDMACDLDNRKSTSGYVYTLAEGAISWCSRLQKIVALSTTEVEYISATEASKEAIWLGRLVRDFDLPAYAPVLGCDSQSALCLAKNAMFHTRTKHIDVRYHFIRQVLDDGLVTLTKLKTQDNPANVLTKCLAKTQHQHCLHLVGFA
ncbi:hypothetical protein L7F22_046244 [Adiantum nelumboides]|nr:hypothetical protein [Adiantum nelumboides]